MNRLCLMIRTFTLPMFLVLIVFSGPQAKAQADTTVQTGSSATLPEKSEPLCSRSALLVLAGVQQGVEAGPVPRLGLLVAMSPTIPLGDTWEFSPEVSLWDTEAYRKREWYFKLALPVRWYAVDSQDVAAYLMAGPGMLFSAPWITLDVGGGVVYTLSPSITLMAEVRSFIHDPSSGANASSFSASPVSVALGVRVTSVK